MELYLNVVEFGPLVYGIGPAARHYFGGSAGQLSLGQALYIASILPNPKLQHFASGGAVTPGWTRYLRKLMKNAHRRGRIDDEQLAMGLREIVVYGSPSPVLEDEAEGLPGDVPVGDVEEPDESPSP